MLGHLIEVNRTAGAAALTAIWARMIFFGERAKV
jgi:hypothetical protein